MTQTTAEQGTTRRKQGNPVFQEYMDFILKHPNYAGMPDPYYDDGGIQWESPANRTSGKFMQTNTRRREWWHQKALSLGMSPTELGKVAKYIHPTKQKPCKVCGRVMTIRYAYPNAHLVRRLQRVLRLSESFILDEREHIIDLIKRLVATYGAGVLADLRIILRTATSPAAPETDDLESWLVWLDNEFIPSEPSLLSPGAMANPVERFDGFHSYNRCCRGESDKGRHRNNLNTYVTDRRVFEHWASGDWIAADRLWGSMRHFSDEPCRHSHPGPCSMDHIGPISLGFTHRPEFQLLCRPCNSRKNNRMTEWDVHHLIDVESIGEEIISWHSRRLWDLRKHSVTSDETALRLSKLLRDHRHSIMAALRAIANAGHYAFLSTLLELHYADYEVKFDGLHVENSVTVFTAMRKTRRRTKYASEQKARRCRIAFQQMSLYFAKGNRSEFVVRSKTSDMALAECLRNLALDTDVTSAIDDEIKDAVLSPDPADADDRFRKIAPVITGFNAPHFEEARGALQRYTDEVGTLLAAMWNDDRYVRPEWETNDDGESTG